MGVEVNDLKDVSGGFVFNGNGEPKHPWEVLDDKSGEVLARFGTKKRSAKFL